MKTDLYTKAILTVIAIFLGVLIFQNTSVISTVQANTAATSPATLPTATQAAPVDVNITHIGGLKLVNNTYKSALNIEDGLPVQIQKNNDK
ncbi:hypothetical protein G7051_12145 [Dysgonomonas sp. HDW5B]|uniref:hypothetical protein n=1 Tax=Dysgonomonas sp. HDW5B TaxID=2714927 RepID=UPI0014093566|nr:hypothetical protein [Dysgonomonas sp. HDW5B]QIK55050.1 hypothetical protein G7051_12145 [Dysgonomonas sp. HDW5B]